MLSLRQQDYYELLELPADASTPQIDRAYRIAQVTYRPSSLATYSLLSDQDSRQILERVEEAYTVLSDPLLRREYDGRRQPAPVPPVPASEPRPIGPPKNPEPVPYPARSPQADLELEESVEPEDGMYDGEVLRRIRLSRGVEFEDISAITKINETYLRFIEENRFLDLPAAVYVRGFLQQYARCLRLDPDRVTQSYMTRYYGGVGERNP